MGEEDGYEGDFFFLKSVTIDLLLYLVTFFFLFLSLSYSDGFSWCVNYCIERR